MTRSREFLRELAEQAEDKKVAKRLRRADTVAKIVSLARSNPAQAAGVAQWDQDPWVLGTPGGTVDLRTGELRPADPSDYITKTTSVAPAPAGTEAPLWFDFLRRITAKDQDLQDYKKRFFGYGLTGSIREHAFVFGHGTGANGKGVLVNTMKGVLGEYAISIPTDMLMISQTDRHPTELARLRGVRLAIGSKTEQGKRWAEAKIKALTGGDTIPARFMRQDFFEFDPQFKLFVVGNHRPSLRGVDEAMRRRLHLVPFNVTIPEEERDLDLEKKLRPEWPAILRWAIDGCLEWQVDGLNPPESVQSATDEYMDAEDAVSIWLQEHCTTENPNLWESATALYKSWKRWAEEAGEYAGSKKRLSQTLEDRGFRKKRQPGSGLRGFVGLQLIPRDDDDRRWT